jgi:hypothetical protein
MVSRLSRSLWCSAFALSLLTVSEAGAQTLQAAFSESVRGGLTTDAWGETSSTTSFVRGEFHVQVPRGARVRWARLFSGYTAYYADAMRPAWPPSVPPGPSGMPRQVIVGTPGSTITRDLEGVPRFYSSTIPTTGRTAYWGTFITDVTSAVREVVGPSARGGVVNVPVAERGDDAAREGFNVIQIGGHFLVVVYELDFGPRRNVVVYEGAATSGFESTALPLPGAVANRCPLTGTPRGEPFAASVGVMWEFNRRPNAATPSDPATDTCSEEESSIFVNGNTLTTRAGGADDWPSVMPGVGCFGDTAGLVSMGTFGGTEPGPGRAVGSPVGLDGDQILTAPSLPRLDDELYDFRTVVRDGATAMQFRFGTDGDELIPVIAFQTLARVNTTDADGDTWLDEIEGDCTIDTDNDGTPDYLDIDSDNDCLPDMRETAAGRTNPSIPGSPNANCSATAPICDTTAGVCLCNASSDCTRAPDAPVCDLATRTCVACSSDAQCASIDPMRPVCSMSGSRRGQCVACTSAMHCSAPTPRCDTAQNICVACLTSRECTDPSRPVCDAATHVCRPCNPATATADCTDMATMACASMGPNAGRCVQCTTMDSRACVAPAAVCNDATNRCVACVAGDAARVCAMSTDGTACVTDPSGSRRCGCMRDPECGSTTSGRICDPSMLRCRPGCWPGDGHNGCPTGQSCSSNDSTRPGTCSPGCFRDLDCVRPDAFCQGATATVAGRCVECLTDTHCSGRSDGRTHCSAQSRCVVPAQSTYINDGGCGCRVGNTRSGFARGAVLLLALVGLRVARRRRRVRITN